MGNVILIGFMGSGKTTVGFRLSYRLRKPVLDTDKEIEREEQRPISEIFATDGEAYFRDKETMCLQKLLRTAKDQIISVGGGLPLREENRRLLKRLGQVFYLQASAETIYERVKYDTSRPLLQGDNPQAKIRTMLAERDSYYKDAADFTINVDDKSFEQIMCEIEEKLG